MSSSESGPDRVRAALAASGLSFDVKELSASTRSAADAAKTIGCEVAEIAKSIVFRTKGGKLPILVVASGVNRINENRLAELIGEAIERPDAAYVREVTGYAIGGVPPVGHAHPVRVFVDEDLSKFARVWAAAGAPNAVFSLTPQELISITGGTVASVT